MNQCSSLLHELGDIFGELNTEQIRLVREALERQMDAITCTNCGYNSDFCFGIGPLLNINVTNYVCSECTADLISNEKED